MDRFYKNKEEEHEKNTYRKSRNTPLPPQEKNSSTQKTQEKVDNFEKERTTEHTKLANVVCSSHNRSSIHPDNGQLPK